MKQFSTFIILLVSTTFFSQTNFSISGSVCDSNNNSIDFADVLLVSKETEKIISYTFVEQGKFNFENIKKGEYSLKIISLSHNEFAKEIALTKNSKLQFSLTNKNEFLNEIEIIARRSLIENKKGNLHISVENSILSKEATITSLLAKLPKLQLNESQESIEIIGKGIPLIYINNQQVTFQALSNLQVDEIKTIEIINNPSAKYEANANSVLLITLKKNKSDGLKILLKETASLKTYFNNYLSSYVNLKKGNIETKLSLARNSINVWESNTAFYKIPSRNVISDYLVTAITNRKQLIFNGGIYLQINEKDFFSINSNTQIREEPFSINTVTNYTENNNTNFIDTKSNDFSNRVFTTSTLNYQKYFKNSDALFFGAQHSFYQHRIENNITNTFNNVSSNINRLQDFSINSVNFKINYEKKLNANKHLEIGTNYAETKTVTENETMYQFIEKNKALYTQFSNELSNKLSYSLGLRIEQNEAIGRFTNSETNEYENKNTQLFPKFNIHYPLKEQQSLTFNYSKSINRPRFSSVSNTSAFINPYLEFTGNLNLTNAIINETSLTYLFNKKSITLQYSYTEKPIRSYTFNYDINKETTRVLPLNFINQNYISLETSIPFSYRFWSSENSISFIYSDIKDERNIETTLQPYLYYYSSQKFSINTSTSFNLNLWGTTLQGENAFITKPVFVLNTSFHKKIKNIDITLSYNDIFKSFTFGERYTLNNIKVDNLFFIDANEISLSLKYDFGKINKPNYQHKNISNTNRIR